MLPHGISYYQPNVQMASLDHALWFHRPFRADEWLLYSFDSPTAQGGRGLARGQIFEPRRPAGRLHRAGRPDPHHAGMSTSGLAVTSRFILHPSIRTH